MMIFHEELSYLPNIKSAAKRDSLSKAKNLVNKARKSELKTNLKKFDAAIAEGNKDEATSAYKVAIKNIDHAAGSHLLHKNNAAHKKSKITLKLNSLAE